MHIYIYSFSNRKYLELNIRYLFSCRSVHLESSLTQSDDSIVNSHSIKKTSYFVGTHCER